MPPMPPMGGASMPAMGGGSAWPDSGGRMSFKEDVLPMLKNRCQECHVTGGDGERQSGLNLDGYDGLMRGTKFGPVVVPGNAMVSNLVVLVEGRAGIRMPHNRRPLSKCEVQMLRDWINQGALNN
ncbi:MAG: hypothetical protein HQL51_04635 [Magnetococcales bacterium]|nr:hypothetical protein [Magnetococcales bacterium]